MKNGMLQVYVNKETKRFLEKVKLDGESMNMTAARLIREAAMLSEQVTLNNVIRRGK